MIQVKRVYEAPASSDGERILVDRVWPRGVSKEKADVRLWLKEVAPSTELRKWFGHDPAKWEEFRRKYWNELDQNRAVADQIRDEARKGTVTLVYSAKDEQHNQAVALKEYLDQHKS